MSEGRVSPLFTWRTAVVRSDLTSTQKLVCLALSLFMSEDGSSAWPSINTLGQRTSLNTRSVQRALREVWRLGWIAVDESKGGGQVATNRYTATVPPTPLPLVNPRHTTTPGTEPPVAQDRHTPGTESPDPWHSATQPRQVPRQLPRQVGARSQKPPSEPPPPQDWTGFEDIEVLLSSLTWRGRPLAETDLADPGFWRSIDALTKGTSIYYDDELRSYATWLETRAPSFRRANHRRGFRNWVERDLGRLKWTERKGQSKGQKGRKHA